MSEGLPIGVLSKIIFGDNMDLDNSNSADLDESPDPMHGFILRSQVAAALAKSDGASVVLDMSVPESDVDDDTPVFYKSPKIVEGVSAALEKINDAPFVRVLAKIRSVFDGHPEEYEQAVECVTKIRAAARAEAIAIAAAK